MKKLLQMKFMLLLCALIVGSGTMWAQTSETISANQFGFTSNTNLSDANATLSATNFTLTFAKNDASNVPAYNSSSEEFRLYKAPSSGKNGGSITIASKSENTTFTKIEFNFSNLPTNYSFSEGSYDKTKNEWSGDATTSLTLTNTDLSGQLKIKSMKVYYETTSSYTITAVSNNTELGTVSLSGTTITASPKAGCRYATPAYTVSPENSATVVQDGNTFTVTPTANTTITINFEAIPTHTATFSVNGTTTTTDFEEGADITFPANPTDIDGKSFVGWTATAINGITNTAPDFVTSATMGNDDITYYAVFAEVTPGTSTSITDHLTTSTFGSPSSYGNWSGKKATDGSDAVYAGNSTTYNNTAIQLRAQSPSGIITTTSGGKAKKVTVTWNSGTTTGRTLDIYGKNTAYSAASDLYGNATAQGTKIGSIVYGTSTELTISGDYEFIGLRSNNGAMYLEQIDINWETGTPDTYSGYCTTVAADNREEAGLSFTESTATVEWYSANQYTGQALTNPHSVSPITWTSSNEGVATVENGTVTVLALGETTIKASFDGDENYKKGEASYTLTVVDNRQTATVTWKDADGNNITELNVEKGDFIQGITLSCNVEGFTFTEEHLQHLWGTNETHDNYVGLQPAGYIFTPNAVWTAALGITTITATFPGNETHKPASATLTVTVTGGTEKTPYTVAEARAAIDAGTGITGVYATGIVSEIVTAFNSQYGNITYNISADGLTTSDQLQAYRGKSYNGEAFTSADDIRVGDVVVIYGTLQKYGSTYEFGEGNQLVSLDRPIVPTIIVADATINVNASSQSITRGITVNNLTISDADNFHIKYYNANDEEISDPDWIEATVTVENSAYVLSCTVAANDVEARTAYLKVYAMNGDETIYSNLVTITQAQYVPDYATLPFEFDFGRADIEETNGLTQNDLGSDYASSPKLKFDSTGDYLVLKIDEAPGKLTFDIVGNSFSGGTFKVQTSADGVTFTDLASYTSIGSDTETKEFDDLADNVRYIKWIYTSKSSGNVGLGNIKLAKLSTDPVIKLAETSVEVDAKQHDGTIALTYKNLQIDDMEDFSVQFFSDEQGTVTTSAPEWVEALVAAQDPSVGPGYVLSYVINANDGAERTAYLRVYANDGVNSVASDVVTITQKAPQATYRKVTSTVGITSGKYLIVYEEESKVFNGSLGTLDAANNCQEVVINDNEIKTNEAIYFNIDVNAGTLQSASGKYIGVDSNSNGLSQSEESKTYTNSFSIDGDGNAVIAAVFTGSTMTLRFNSNTNQNRFRYFKNNQKAIQLYKEVTDEEKMAIPIAAACTDGQKCYSTFSSTKPFVVPENLTVSEVEIKPDGTMNFSNYTTGDIVPANTGVMVSAAKGDRSYVVNISNDEEGTSIFGDDNALRPTGDDGITADEMDGKDSGCKFYRLTMHNGEKIGFWWGADGGDSFDIAANKAYLAVPASVAGARNGFAFGDDATGINNVNINLNDNDNCYDLQGRKVNKPGKGLYIVNGKKVVIK